MAENSLDLQFVFKDLEILTAFNEYIYFMCDRALWNCRDSI